MENKLTLEHLAPYLPYGVKFINIERVYFGGINKDSYSEKRGELAYTNKRVGKIKGYKDGKILTTIGYFKIEEPTFTFIGAHVTHNNERKLILRPLSDLTKEIEHNGEKFVPIDYINGEFRLEIPNKIELQNWVKNRSIHFVLAEWVGIQDLYKLFKLLFQWHFDLHGLIDKGLAVDINTLKGGQYE